MTEKVRFSLHSKQRIVFNALKEFRFVVLDAGRRFGKTTLAIIVLIISALTHPESLYWYVAPSYRQAKMIAWRMLKRLSPRFLVSKINEAELSILYTNGATVELKGAENEDSLRGMGIWGIVIDEFAVIYNKWAVWNEVLRPALTDKKGWGLFIGTPKGKDAFWELFMKGQRKEDGFKSFRFKTADNPFIDPQEVEKARQELPERYFRQEYEASFEDYTGLIWPEFTKSHLIKPIYLDKALPRLGAIDPATTGTTGALKCAIDEDGVLYFYEEYYEANKRVSEVAEGIKDNIRWLIDPASKGKSIEKMGKLYSLYSEYQENGIIAQVGENDVDGGINRVAEYFKAGKIKIFDTCKHLIWELERYHWTEDKETSLGVIKPKPYHANCHLCDCLRYIVMSHAQKADLRKTVKVERYSPQYFMNKDNSEESAWRNKYK